MEFTRSGQCDGGRVYYKYKSRDHRSLGISSIIYLPSGTRGVVAQSPEPGAHDKSD